MGDILYCPCQEESYHFEKDNDFDGIGSKDGRWKREALSYTELRGKMGATDKTDPASVPSAGQALTDKDDLSQIEVLTLRAKRFALRELTSIARIFGIVFVPAPV
jgi:hypothetical protein